MSTNKFERWEPHTETSWEWRLFKKRNEELMRMFYITQTTQKFVYSSLKEKGAVWSASPDTYFDVCFRIKPISVEFTDLKEWSKSYDKMINWTNLNTLIALTSNLETYMCTIIELALSSDLGVRFGCPRQIDGFQIVLNSPKYPYDFSKEVTSCTKGTWDSRINAYESLFLGIPKIFNEKKEELEEIRNLRNDIAHALGKDINKSRKSGTLENIPTKKLSAEKILLYQDLLWKCAKSIEGHLYKKHIGEYELLMYYHSLVPGLSNDKNLRVNEFKEAIYKYGDVRVSKEYCNGLFDYYNSLKR